MSDPSAETLSAFNVLIIRTVAEIDAAPLEYRSTQDFLDRLQTNAADSHDLFPSLLLEQESTVHRVVELFVASVRLWQEEHDL